MVTSDPWKDIVISIGKIEKAIENKLLNLNIAKFPHPGDGHSDERQKVIKTLEKTVTNLESILTRLDASSKD